MMKKLLLFFIAFLAINTALKAQAQAPIPVNDTLKYFSYKQHFRLPVASNSLHPTYKSSAKLISSINAVTHVGSVFRNKDTSLVITGLEARVLIPNLVFSGPQNGGVPFRLYLCNVNANNTPIFPPVDSVRVTGLNPPSGGAAATTARRLGQYAGGTFTNGPRTIKGNFAVLAMCTSTLNGDTVAVMRTSGHTATSTTAPSNAHKFGEGLGVIRINGQFLKTTNLVNANANFGVGTDYEFCVAPMVQFTLQVSQNESKTQEGACQWEVFTNTNTSSPEFSNKQFNFNEFARQLKPLDIASPMTNFVSDSVLTWDVGDGTPPFYLPPNVDTIQLQYGGGVYNVFYTGSMVGKYKQAAYNVSAPTISMMLTYTGSTVWCLDFFGSSIHEMGQLSKLKIYPNPAADKTTISGLEGTNTIYLYNMLGQLLATEVTNLEVYCVDLFKQPQGNYLLRISNSQNNTRLVKVVKQ